MQGLKDKDFKRIKELLIMANDIQVKFIWDTAREEANKRFEKALNCSKP